MANVFPKQAKKEIVDAWLAELNWKVALLNSAFIYDHTTDITYTDVSPHEMPASGTYAATGIALAGRTGGYVDTHNYYLNATDVQWTGVTFTNVRYIVVYDVATGNIRFIFDLGGASSCTNSTFDVVWDADGLVEVTS